MTDVTIRGRLGADPTLKFTSSGKAVCELSVVTSRNKKQPDGKWEETETTWRRATLWDSVAENAAETFSKGDDVIIIGREYLEEWEAKDGHKGITLRVQVYEVGASLKRVSWRRDPIPTRGSSESSSDPWGAAPQADEVPF